MLTNYWAVSKTAEPILQDRERDQDYKWQDQDKTTKFQSRDKDGGLEDYISE